MNQANTNGGLVTRRNFLRSSAAAAGIASLSSAGAFSGTDKKPNILLIMTDQQTAFAMSCAGNPYLHTPALDALAAHGVRFERAYVTQPLCMPCRSSLQTARYPHEIGVVCNGLDIRGEFPMLGTLMGNAGYENAYIGKWHVGTSFEKAGYTGEASDFRPDQKKTATAVSFLKRKHEEPFFLTVSFMNPHNVCELARGQELPDGAIPAPPKELDALPPLPDNFAIPATEPAAIRKVKQSISEHYPTRDWGELEWRQYLWGYYRLVEKVDGEIGCVLDALAASDYGDSTVVAFVSDHGEGIAMHHWNQKQVLYDQCTRVPLILAGPGIQQGKVSAELISTALDIPQTLLDIAGASVPDSMRGLSLRALASGAVETLEREYVVAETVFARNTDLLGLRGRMLRTEQYKYCVYDVGENREQLFDMTADPGETNNLAVQQEHHVLLKQQRTILSQWAEDTQDNDFPYSLNIIS